MRLSKRRKLKFLRDERITVKNSRPSVRSRRERSPPGKAGSQGGGAARPASSARSSSEANTEVAGVGKARAPVGSRAQVGCSCPPARGPHREVSRASPAQLGNHPGNRRAEEPPRESHVGRWERGGRWAPGSRPQGG